MKNKDKVINNLDIAILSQLNNVTAYGINGQSINPFLGETLDNEDIENEKDKLRE